MCEIQENVDSLIKRIDKINAHNLQEVYDFYSKYRNSFNDDDVKKANKRNPSLKNAYEKLNQKIKQINSGIDNGRKTKIFLSHSHEDFEYTYRIAVYLKSNYNVDIYIDELDSFMPLSTNSVTAKKIIKKIRECDRFIFVGTKNSFSSKWCNWELGLAHFKNAQGHLAFFVMNDYPEKNGKYRDNEYVELYPFVWDKKILKIESNEEELFVGYYKDFDNKNSFVPLTEWLRNDKSFFEKDSALINEKKTFAAFYFSKFRDAAKVALGYRTFSEAFSDIALRIGGHNNTYLPWRRYEFDVFFENRQRGVVDPRTPRRVLDAYNQWDGKTMDELTREMLEMIGRR